MRPDIFWRVGFRGVVEERIDAVEFFSCLVGERGIKGKQHIVLENFIIIDVLGQFYLDKLKKNLRRFDETPFMGLQESVKIGVMLCSVGVEENLRNSFSPRQHNKSPEEVDEIQKTSVLSETGNER